MDTNVTERPIITMEPVKSSQIAAIGHHPETGTLAIRFPPNKRGVSSVYHYANFTPELFDEFQKAHSKGSFFIRRIKNAADQFPYVNVTELYDSAEAA